MSSIRILSDRVANQIAAGEVIERPVAVVKELIENSIDAGATRIEVEFRNGGKSYIRVEDNGRGMSPDEALIALERHATSKIREAADLLQVSTFGFRGEALPSIASVSRFTLRTRAEGWTHGTEILVNGGKLLEKRDCGMPVGTVIEVAHLFNSVPARRKFLKTEPTETAHITYTTRLFAVAHPKVAFRVLEQGRTVFQSPSCEDLRDRISEIWGSRLAADLMPVDLSDAAQGLRLHGLTAKPGVGRSTRRELVTMVNRRPVDSRTLGFAVMDAYHGYLPKGRYPPAFLFLEIDPEAVDVNVHPAKREVRFREEGAVRRFVLGAVMQALKEAREPSLPVPEKAVPDAQPPRSKLADAVLAAATSARPKAPESPPPAAFPAKAPATVTPTVVTPDPATQDPIRNWRFIACLRHRYALFETPDGLLTLQIRHADQRVRYERIRKEWEKTAAASQQMLIPLPMEFEPLAAEALKSQLEVLRRQGFGIEEFGRNFYRVESVPTWLDPDDTETFVRDLVDTIRQRGDLRKNGELGWEAVARLAARRAVRRKDAFSERLITQLARELMACENPHTTPFGKPVFIAANWNDLENRFGGA